MGHVERAAPALTEIPDRPFRRRCGKHDTAADPERSAAV